MTHPLDPGAPLKHADGSEYSDEERLAFFQDVETTIRNSYRNERANYYQTQLTVGNQLDLLWHELNETGTISKDGAWFNAVKAVKDNKPKDDSAYQKAVEQVVAIRLNKQRSVTNE